MKMHSRDRRGQSLAVLSGRVAVMCLDVRCADWEYRVIFGSPVYTRMQHAEYSSKFAVRIGDCDVGIRVAQAALHLESNSVFLGYSYLAVTPAEWWCTRNGDDRVGR
jgi:hypothetical protein